MTNARLAIVDLFAGPGGLGEGFSSIEANGKPLATIALSIEKDGSAHNTLRLRSFLRQYKLQHGRLPEEYIRLHAGLLNHFDAESSDAALWRTASSEARCLELGSPDANSEVDRAIGRIRKAYDDSILIGGPPCQAYSLVGRARSKAITGYVPEEDHRHYLFREYIRVLDRLRPAAFVMENVRGLLSSKVENKLVFEMLLADLASLGKGRGHKYEIRAIQLQDGFARLIEPQESADFLVRAEDFGVPQRRHRLFVIGLRADIGVRASDKRIVAGQPARTVHDAIGNLPALRSGLSSGIDGYSEWQSALVNAARTLSKAHFKTHQTELRNCFRTLASSFRQQPHLERRSSRLPETYATSNDILSRWLENPQLEGLAQHDTRGHMHSDLYRYLFVATYGHTFGSTPKADVFPPEIAPEHRNWDTGIFSDRFRVQLRNDPSTTITSHISKDGHYFIHPDPLQCRSLTVREAARLQTFPDDYLFLGNRTQQYVQVGNAVPPLLARQVAKLLHMHLRGYS